MSASLYKSIQTLWSQALVRDKEKLRSSIHFLTMNIVRRERSMCHLRVSRLRDPNRTIYCLRGGRGMLKSWMKVIRYHRGD